MTGYSRHRPNRHDQKETGRIHIDRWPDRRTGGTTMTKEPDDRNDIRNELEAGERMDRWTVYQYGLKED